MYVCVSRYVCSFSTLRLALIFLICVADYCGDALAAGSVVSFLVIFHRTAISVQDRSHSLEATWICTKGITTVFQRMEGQSAG